MVPSFSALSLFHKDQFTILDELAKYDSVILNLLENEILEALLYGSSKYKYHELEF